MVDPEVLTELPQNQILEALAVVMRRHPGGPFFSYLKNLGNLCASDCAERRDLFLDPANFYRLMMQALRNAAEDGHQLSEDEVCEILKALPEVLSEVLLIHNRLAEKFVFQIFSIAPILNPNYLARVLAAPQHTSEPALVRLSIPLS